MGHETTEVEKANFEKLLLSLKQTLNAWKGRYLSLKGKVLIAKTLGLSKFLFLSKVMHILILIKNEIDRLIYNCIWNGNTDKVRRNIFMQKICNGGYNMHDFNTVDKSLKIMWMKYLLDENNNMWKGYILEVLGKENINILFRSKYTEYMVPSFSKLPLFYKEVFTHWKFVKYKNNDNVQEIKSQFVWYNSDVFRKDDGPFYNKSLFQAGLWYIKDIFDKEGKIVSFEIWLKRGVTYKHYLALRKVISLVEMTVKKKIQELNDISEINIFTGIELSGKRISLSKIKIKTLKKRVHSPTRI